MIHFFFKTATVTSSFQFKIISHKCCLFPSSLRSFFWIVPSTTHLKTKHFQISIPPLFLSNITASGKYLNRFIFSLRLARTNMRASDGTQSKLDCKTVGFFFHKISKEIGKAWRKSLTRTKRASVTRLSVFSLVPDLLFDCSLVLEYAKIRTVLQSKSKPSISQSGRHFSTNFPFRKMSQKNQSERNNLHLQTGLHLLDQGLDV